MEVKPGYKRTEMGVIPDDWGIGRLMDVAVANWGNTTVTKASYSEAGFLAYSASGPDGYVPWHEQEGKGVVLSAIGAQCGKTWLADGRWTPIKNTIWYRGDGVRSSTDYLFWATRDPRIWQNRGQAQPFIALGDVRSLVLPIPSHLREQVAIATALSDADALIESLEQLIAKKRQIKQGAMQELLTGKSRLPGFTGNWVTSCLKDLVGARKEYFDDGDWIESEHITTDGVRLVQTGNIGIGDFVEKEEKKFIYEKSFRSLRCKEVFPGDLLICRLAEPAGRSCVLPDIGERKIVTCVDVTIFRPPLGVISRAYLAQFFSTPRWFSAVSDRSGGTTHKRISRGALGSVPLEVPPRDEQEGIAEVLTAMDEEISALETKLSKARALKQGMMQELLTGRIRLI